MLFHRLGQTPPFVRVASNASGMPLSSVREDAYHDRAVSLALDAETVTHVASLCLHALEQQLRMREIFKVRNLMQHPE